jgi:hypothetical protein
MLLPGHLFVPPARARGAGHGQEDSLPTRDLRRPRHELWVSRAGERPAWARQHRTPRVRRAAWPSAREGRGGGGRTRVSGGHGGPGVAGAARALGRARAHARVHRQRRLARGREDGLGPAYGVGYAHVHA